MKVKLTTRRPGDATLATLCQEGAMMHDDGINAWEAAHDAAPDDATRALVEALQALNEIAQWNQGDLGPGLCEPSSAEAARNALDSLRATPEGAALIRQAEEQGHD